MLNNQFFIRVVSLAIENRVNGLQTGASGEIREEDAGNAHTLSNFAVSLKNKTRSQTFVFLWTPPDKHRSTFASLKADPKTKETAKVFPLSLRLRLIHPVTRAAYWKLKVDFVNCRVKNVQIDPRMDEQRVEIEYESAEYGPE